MTSIGMTEASFCIGMREVTILLSEIKHKTTIPVPTTAHCTTNPPSQQWKIEKRYKSYKAWKVRNKIHTFHKEMIDMNV